MCSLQNCINFSPIGLSWLFLRVVQNDVQLVEVKGAVPSLRLWVHFESVDPALESMSAGQKILLRIGPDNHNRIKAWLFAFRTEILKHGQGQ
jgi:hypothetical protein